MSDWRFPKPPTATLPIVQELFNVIHEERIAIKPLARRAGYSDADLHKWKRGARTPTLSSFLDLAEAAGFAVRLERIGVIDIPAQRLPSADRGGTQPPPGAGGLHQGTDGDAGAGAPLNRARDRWMRRGTGGDK